ncbi:hypothetical protein SAMN02927924_01424 [Sphingobium faniae]|nr:hypothetical protein SAMN02927924_01424 [Sphingobium faniae]
MADETDWNALRQRCADNATELVLRVETMDGEYRFSLAAVDRDGKIMWDNRANDEGHAPQHIVTQLVTSALERWWV